MAEFEIKDGVCIIPEGTTSIPQEAFKNETGLVDVYIPDSVTSIGSLAFDGCTGLKSIGIEENIHSIGMYAFRGCSNIEGIVVSEDNQVFDSRQAKIKVITSNLFKNCTSLESVTLPAGIGKIAADAFVGCSALKTINVPAKKSDYYKKRLPEELHSLIVELPAEKKK